MSDNNDDIKVEDLKDTMPHYSEHPEMKAAVELFKEIRDRLIEEYPEMGMPAVHMAACLLEEVCNRAMPQGITGDMLVTTARLMAPDIVDQVYREEQADAGLFMLPGNDEVH